MIKAIIFDVDDTLICSGPLVSQNYINVAKRLGVKAPTAKEVHRLCGLPGFKMVEILWPGLDYEKFRENYHQIIQVDASHVFPNSKEVISMLSGKYKLGILTSRRLESMQKVLKHYDFDLSDFRFIIATCNSKYHKPDPRAFDPVKKELLKERIKKEEILYVGDAIYDYQAVSGAGLNFVAVTNGAWTKEEFKEAGLSERFIIKFLKELPKVLEKEFQLV